MILIVTTLFSPCGVLTVAPMWFYFALLSSITKDRIQRFWRQQTYSLLAAYFTFIVFEFLTSSAVLVNVCWLYGCDSESLVIRSQANKICGVWEMAKLFPFNRILTDVVLFTMRILQLLIVVACVKHLNENDWEEWHWIWNKTLWTMDDGLFRICYNVSYLLMLQWKSKTRQNLFKTASQPFEKEPFHCQCLCAWFFWGRRLMQPIMGKHIFSMFLGREEHSSIRKTLFPWATFRKYCSWIQCIVSV